MRTPGRATRAESTVQAAGRSWGRTPAPTCGIRDGVWHPNRSLQRDGPGDWPRMRRRSIKRRYGIGLTRHGRRALARYAAEHPPGETLEDTVQGWQMAWPRPVPPQ